MATQDKIELAQGLWKKGEHGEAVELLIDTLKTRDSISSVRLKEANDQRNLGNHERAEEILLLAIRDANGFQLLGRLLHELGTNAQGAGKYEEAINYLQFALKIRTLIDDTLGVAYTSFQIPMCRLVQLERGVVSSALISSFEKMILVNFQDAREKIRCVLKQPELPPEQEGNMRQNLAFCLQSEGNFEDALKEYREVLKIRESAEAHKEPLERRDTALTYARIGDCLLGLGHAEEAREAARKALEIFEHINDKNRIKQIRDLIAKIEKAENTKNTP